MYRRLYTPASCTRRRRLYARAPHSVAHSRFRGTVDLAHSPGCRRPLGRRRGCSIGGGSQNQGSGASWVWGSSPANNFLYFVFFCYFPLRIFKIGFLIFRDPLISMLFVNGNLPITKWEPTGIPWYSGLAQAEHLQILIEKYAPQLVRHLTHSTSKNNDGIRK